MFNLEDICAKVRRTARWADIATIQRLMYATIQHTAAVRSRSEALVVLSGFMAQHQAGGSGGDTSRKSTTNPSPSPNDAAEELLIANVLPHLTSTDAKLEYLAYLIGLLLNHLFLPSARRSNLFDKDHMGIRWCPVVVIVIVVVVVVVVVQFLYFFYSSVPLPSTPITF